MLDVKSALHTHPSLLPLRMALTAAEKETPARPPQQMTVDEQHALDLIERMKTEYAKPRSFSNFVQQSSKSKTAHTSEFRMNFREVIGIHA